MTVSPVKSSFFGRIYNPQIIPISPAQQIAAGSSKEKKSVEDNDAEEEILQDVATTCDNLHNRSVHPTGVEPPQKTPCFPVSPDEGGAKSGAVGEMDPQLAMIIDSWSTLPEAIKAGILAMVRTVK